MISRSLFFLATKNKATHAGMEGEKYPIKGKKGGVLQKKQDKVDIRTIRHDWNLYSASRPRGKQFVRIPNLFLSTSLSTKTKK